MYARVTQITPDSDDEMPLSEFVRKQKAKKAKAAAAREMKAKAAEQNGDVPTSDNKSKKSAAKKPPVETPVAIAKEIPPLVDAGPFLITCGKQRGEFRCIPNFNRELLAINQNVVHWYGEGFDQFFTGTIVRIIVGNSADLTSTALLYWVKFHKDRYTIKFPLGEADYMRTWAFIEPLELVAEPLESQENVNAME